MLCVSASEADCAATVFVEGQMSPQRSDLRGEVLWWPGRQAGATASYLVLPTPTPLQVVVLAGGVTFVWCTYCHHHHFEKLHKKMLCVGVVHVVVSHPTARSPTVTR